MPLTKDFKETVRARIIKSAGFRTAVLQEAIDGLLAGDVDTGKALLRDFVNGTMGFERLGRLGGRAAPVLWGAIGLTSKATDWAPEVGVVFASRGDEGLDAVEGATIVSDWVDRTTRAWAVVAIVVGVALSLVLGLREEPTLTAWDLCLRRRDAVV